MILSTMETLPMNARKVSSGHITLVFFPKLAPTETQTVPIGF